MSENTSLIQKFSGKMGVEPEKMLNTLKQTAFKLPDRKNGNQYVPQEVSNEQMMALLVVADQYNLNPFLKEIYAFPDKGGIVPIVGVDGWSNMMNSNASFDGIEFKESDDWVTPDKGKECPAWMECYIYRKDRSKPVVVREYIDEVYKKTNYASPWQTHTKRFFRHKVMIQCCRIAFGYVGIYDRDEAENIVSAAEPVDITPAETKADKMNKIIDAEISDEEKSNTSEDTTPLSSESQEHQKSPDSGVSGNDQQSDYDLAVKGLCAAQDRAQLDLAMDDALSYEGISITQLESIRLMHADRINELTKTT